MHRLVSRARVVALLFIPLTGRAQDTTGRSRPAIRPWLAAGASLGAMSGQCGGCTSAARGTRGGALDGTVGVTLTPRLALGFRRADWGAFTTEMPTRHATFRMASVQYLADDEGAVALRLGVGGAKLHDGGAGVRANAVALSAGVSLRLTPRRRVGPTLFGDLLVAPHGTAEHDPFSNVRHYGASVIVVGIGVEGWFARR